MQTIDALEASSWASGPPSQSSREFFHQRVRLKLMEKVAGITMPKEAPATAGDWLLDQGMSAYD